MVKNLNQPTYKEFLALVGDYKPEPSIQHSAQFLIHQHLKSLAVPQHIQPATFLLDLTQKKYVSVADSVKNLVGHSSDYFLEGGMDAFFSMWDPHQYDAYNKEGFPEILRFIQHQSQDEMHSLLCSRNHKLKIRDGSTINLLQRNIFIPDAKTGVPIGMFGVITDITHFSNSGSMTYTIEKIADRRELLFKKTILVDESDVLTKREAEVLKWVADGLSNKRIAECMHISEHTVKVHRKNILRKTKCNSSAELIHYGIKNGLF